jgi:hypothetical protein
LAACVEVLLQVGAYQQLVLRGVFDTFESWPFV